MSENKKDKKPKKITKVMKYLLTYLDGAGEFHEMQHYLWNLQKQTREVLNKTIQLAYFLEYTNTDIAEAGYKRADGYIYNQLKSEYPDIRSDNMNASIQKAWKKYRDSKIDILRGDMSLPSYKKDQPIPINAKNVHLTCDENGFIVELAMFSQKFCKEHPEIQRVRFQVKAKDKAQRAIIEYIAAGMYEIGESQLVYEDRCWDLLLTYKFERTPGTLDLNKVLGVDLGCAYALYASSYGNKGAFKIPGDEITAFEKKQAAMQGKAAKSTLDRVHEMEEERWQKQQQARWCGEGRIGHGTKTRVAPAYAARDKLANFQDTINHRYSKALIDYAVKNGYGTIQMENLKGIKENAGYPKRLQHWTYFDLKTKIKNKAEEKGIKFEEINPKYTSQRCSKCGNISAENRPSQELFRCTACGYQTNADYNASQNISIPNIDEIIEKQMGANQNKTD